jgi:plasmid stability protein
MRTTITLDDQLGNKLQDRMRRTGKSFKETVHDLLLAGLSREVKPAAKQFRVKARPMGLKAGIDPSRFHELDAEMDVDRFLEVSSRLALSAKATKAAKKE